MRIDFGQSFTVQQGFCELGAPGRRETRKNKCRSTWTGTGRHPCS